LQPMPCRALARRVDPGMIEITTAGRDESFSRNGPATSLSAISSWSPDDRPQPAFPKRPHLRHLK
jgi:hypothetical protein